MYSIEFSRVSTCHVRDDVEYVTVLHRFIDRKRRAGRMKGKLRRAGMNRRKGRGIIQGQTLWYIWWYRTYYSKFVLKILRIESLAPSLIKMRGIFFQGPSHPGGCNVRWSSHACVAFQHILRAEGVLNLRQTSKILESEKPEKASSTDLFFFLLEGFTSLSWTRWVHCFYVLRKMQWHCK